MYIIKKVNFICSSGTTVSPFGMITGRGKQKYWERRDRSQFHFGYHKPHAMK
jgi:hypothetical protein